MHMHRAMMIVGQVGICFNGVFDVAVGGCSCSQTQAMVKPASSQHRYPHPYVWYGMYVCMVSMHKGLKGDFKRIWLAGTMPYKTL